MKFVAPKSFDNLERGKVQIEGTKRFLFGWIVKSSDIGTLITDRGQIVQGRIR